MEDAVRRAVVGDRLPTVRRDLPEVLAEMGGVARRGALVAACGRAAVDAGVRSGDLVVLARGTYASAASADSARSMAAALSGVLSHRSAALAWGWAVRSIPERPDVVVAKNRRVEPSRASAVQLHRATLHPDDVVDGRTSRDRTLVDCLRSLPLSEALAVADSALREGVPRSRLLAVARDARGPGSPRVRRVAELADGRAANPFESALRATCLDVPGLQVTPQVPIVEGRWLGRPDLVDQRLRIAVEADSFAWHGDRVALRRDANRYNALVAAGWLVLRFSWEDVMHEATQVRAVLEEVVHRRTEVLCRGCGDVLVDAA